MISFVEYILLINKRCFNIFGDNMDIFYTNNTLYVSLEKEIDIDSISILRNKVFSILDDYEINNIVISLQNNHNMVFHQCR